MMPLIDGRHAMPDYIRSSPLMMLRLQRLFLLTQSAAHYHPARTRTRRQPRVAYIYYSAMPRYCAPPPFDVAHAASMPYADADVSCRRRVLRGFARARRLSHARCYAAQRAAICAHAAVTRLRRHADAA